MIVMDQKQKKPNIKLVCKFLNQKKIELQHTLYLLQIY